jgi:hypothetical protein
MYPLNDKDLDRLSREAAEQYDVPQSTSGWEHLQNRLDQELPVREKRRRRFLLLLLAVLVAGGGLVYMLTGSPEEQRNIAGQPGKTVVSPGAKPSAGTGVSDAPAASSSEKNTEDEVVMQLPEKPVNNRQPLPAEKSLQPGGTSNPTLVDKRNDDYTADRPASPGSRAADSGVPSRSAREQKQDATDAKVKQDKALPLTQVKRHNETPGEQEGKEAIAATKHAKDAPITPVQPGKDALQPEQTQDKVNNEGNASDVFSQKSLPASLPQLATASSLLRSGIPYPGQLPVAAAPAPAAQQANKIHPQPVRQWEFGITGGPDYSHVKNKYFDRSGFNIGVTVGFRFSDRWQVNTGVLYAKKYYKTAGEDFKPTYWPQNWEMLLTSGECSMLEIPLNIRYDISYNEKRRFFVSAGASAWLMDNENYICTYKYGSNVYNYPWLSDANAEYLVSSLNFSAGYERNIGNHFSIQAEPYLKLPVKKVGWGNINLGSYGMLFSVKYRLR